MSKESKSVQISKKEAYLFWLKLGFMSFGGPAGQIAIMHQELVERRRWISENRFLHALNFTMLLPGPEAQQLATYIGWLMHGIRGGLIAGGLFILPSLCILIGLSWAYLVYGQTEFVAGVLFGIKPAVTAIVVFAAYKIGKKALRNWLAACIALFAFIAIFIIKLPFPAIMMGAGLTGWFVAKWKPELLGAKKMREQVEDRGSYVIGDHSFESQRNPFSLKRMVMIGAVSLGLMLLGAVMLFLWQGRDGTLFQMAVFFTKSAFVTFGGAYAVLPYVQQAGVNEFGWLSLEQMMDGLALGETTPGPLIMIVAFVGFVGSALNQSLVTDSLLWNGAVGACVATFFTFVPCFLFIFIGAPLIEKTRDSLKFTAPLSAITAAVVGVIVNLAMVFLLHVLWPEGVGTKFEWPALCIGLVVAVLLFRNKLGVIPLILLAGGLGYLCSIL